MLSSFKLNKSWQKIQRQFMAEAETRTTLTEVNEAKFSSIDFFYIQIILVKSTTRLYQSSCENLGRIKG